jgi:hypothetical protein
MSAPTDSLVKELCSLPLVDTAAAIRSARRVCFFAHYHPHGLVADHVLYYLGKLADAGFSVVVLSTATLVETEKSKLEAASKVLVMRENHGLDFGGWIEAVAHYFPLTAEFLLLANDSVYGPLSDLGDFIERLTSIPADFYGVIESYEISRHFQSWFLLLRPSAYRSSAFRDLMSKPIGPTLSKRNIIDKYEIGFSNCLEAEGLSGHAAWSAAYSGRIARERGYNPMHMLWRRMIKNYGIPFLKIELLRDNPLHVADFDRWEELVRVCSPELLSSIREDLLLRQNTTSKSTFERFACSIGSHHSISWPEMQIFLKADECFRNGFVNSMIWISFRISEGLGRCVRKLTAEFNSQQ